MERPRQKWTTTTILSQLFTMFVYMSWIFGCMISIHPFEDDPNTIGKPSFRHRKWIKFCKIFIFLYAFLLILPQPGLCVYLMSVSQFSPRLSENIIDNVALVEYAFS